MSKKEGEIIIKLQIEAKASQKELDTLNRRLDKSRKATKEVKSSALDLKSVLTAGLGFAGVSAGLGLVTKGFNDVVKSTNATGDAWDQMMGGMTASYDSLLTSLARGDGWDTALGKMEEANELGREYVALMDSLFELQLSNDLAASKAVGQLAEYRRVFMDASQAADVQKVAINEAITLENSLVDAKIITAKAALEAAETNSDITSKLSADAIVANIEDRAINNEKLKAANIWAAKNAEITRIQLRSLKEILLDKWVGFDGDKRINELQTELAENYTKTQETEHKKTLAEDKAFQNNTVDAKVQALVTANINLNKADAEKRVIAAKYARYLGTINNKITKAEAAAEKERIAALQKATDDKQAIADASEQRTKDVAATARQDAQDEYEYNLWLANDQATRLYNIEKERLDNEKKLKEEARLEDLENARRLTQQKQQLESDLISTVSSLVSVAQDMSLKKAEGNEREQERIRKRFALLDAGVAAASVLIQAQVASVTALAQLGPVAGALAIPFIQGGAALSLVTIAAQQAAIQSMAKGGIIKGNSHAQGGVKVNSNTEAEGGEAILNKKSMSIPAFRSLASAINVAGGGVSFDNSSSSSSNALMTASISTDTIRAIVKEVVAIPVVVSERDITGAQRKIEVTTKRSQY